MQYQIQARETDKIREMEEENNAHRSIRMFPSLLVNRIASIIFFASLFSLCHFGSNVENIFFLCCSVMNENELKQSHSSKNSDLL